MNRKSRIFRRILIAVILLPFFLFLAAVAFFYVKQDMIVKELLTKMNEDFRGEIKIGDSHISPFENFPQISIDIDDLKVFESKDTASVPVMELKDIYLGFNLLTLLKGEMSICSIKLKNGAIHVIQRENGEFNIVNAFQSVKPVESAEDEFHLDLKSVALENIDLTKVNEVNKITVEAFVNSAHTRFKTSDEHLMIDLDSKFVLNVIKDKDTTFFKHKHISFDTQLDYYLKEDRIVLSPTSVDMEHALFDVEGNASFAPEMKVDFKIQGHKPNFDMFLAFAPEELTPVLKKYDNKGKIFFEALIRGAVTATQMPHIDVRFGCEKAFLRNTDTDKRLDDLNFKAHFTNGDSAKLSTMKFSLTDFSSRPEAGLFSGHLIVKNFERPEIDTRIVSDFDLDFLSKFLNLKDITELKGKIKLTMNFRDVIDLEHPERAIEKLNESYYTALQVEGLSFKANFFPLPLSKMNVDAVMEGHEARIRKFEMNVGGSDLSVDGSISDLPAILHHTRDLVMAELNIRSKYLDIAELTSGKGKTPVDEQISDLRMKFSFKSSARAFTESPYLPVGEFFIDDLYAKLKHYPHTLHDFKADVIIDTNDFRIIDFKGFIDKSDFHFSGKLKHYDLWFAPKPKGDTRIDFDLSSGLLRLEDLFAYKGENYVPEDYRHEELRDFKLLGHVFLHFNEGLRSTDLYLDNFTSKMKSHHYKFERFKGRVHFEDEHLVMQGFSGKLGKSDFKLDLNYYLGKDNAVRKRDNHIGLTASTLDLDELFLFNPAPAAATATVDHEKGFNIYEVPFTDMSIDLKIDHLNYHRYLLNNFRGKLRTTQNHYIYIDTLSMLAADGKIDMRGYFNGSDKNKIYFSPVMKFDHVDLDKLMWKFENFGQDHFVSENVHGTLSGKVTGKIHMHRDMVPIMDDSEIHMEVEVINGKLEKYAPLTAMADYFKDKNVSRVLFDTLRNRFDMNKGVLSFPLMTINSSLGFMEIAGKQDMNFNMEYYFKIPMKMVTGIAKQKLFGGGGSAEADPEKEDEIVYKDNSKKIRYVNLKLSGNTENYKISLVKNKEIQKG